MPPSAAEEVAADSQSVLPTRAEADLLIMEHPAGKELDFTVPKLLSSDQELAADSQSVLERAEADLLTMEHPAGEEVAATDRALPKFSGFDQDVEAEIEQDVEAEIEQLIPQQGEACDDYNVGTYKQMSMYNWYAPLWNIGLSAPESPLRLVLRACTARVNP